MSDLVECLAGGAWMAAGAATWLWLMGRRLLALDRYDWWALPATMLLWPLALVYVKAWLRGYEAAHQARDIGGGC